MSTPWKQEVASRRIGSKLEEKLWEEVQKKTFQGWVNMHLEKRGMSVENLDKDFADGVKLINLIEILHGKKIEGRYYKNPKSRPYKIDNVNFALTFITDNIKIKLFGCSAEDIVDGNLKITLGMLWRLIQKYQLSDSQTKSSLLQWVRNMTSGYDGIVIDNMHDGFADGRAFCALLELYDSNLLTYSSLDLDDRVANLKTAFDLAEQHLNVPRLLDPADVAEKHTDERSVLTYVSLWHSAFTLKGITSKVPVDVSPLSPKKAVETATEPVDSGRIKELEDENSSLRSDLDYVREELNSARLALSSLEEDHKEVKESLATAIKEKEQAEAASRSVSGEEEAATVDEPEAKPDLDEAVAAKEAELEKVNASIAEEESRLKTLQEQCAELEAKMKDAIDMENEASTKHKELQESIAALEEKQTAVREAAGEGMEADTFHDTIMAEQQLEELQERIAELNKTMGQKEARLAQLQKGIDTIAPVAAHSPDLEMQQALEDAKEELMVVKKKYERAQAQALKKQKKKYQTRVKSRDKEIKALREQLQVDIKTKDDEIALLKTQLGKAQRALGEVATDGVDDAMAEDIKLLQDSYTEMLAIAKMLEDEENNTRTQRHAHNSDSENEAEEM